MSEGLSRREFVSASTKIAVACCLLPFALEASEGKAVETAGVASLDLAAPENAPLKAKGGAIYFEAASEKKPVIVWREGESSYKAFSSACTHKGVKIDLPKDGKMVCPAHGATFDAEGKAIKGPAKTPLKEFKCSLEGETLKISLKG